MEFDKYFELMTTEQNKYEIMLPEAIKQLKKGDL